MSVYILVLHTYSTDKKEKKRYTTDTVADIRGCGLVQRAYWSIEVLQTDLGGHEVGGEDSVCVDDFHRESVSTGRLGNHLHRSTTDVTGIQVERGKALGHEARASCRLHSSVPR